MERHRDRRWRAWSAAGLPVVLIAVLSLAACNGGDDGRSSPGTGTTTPIVSGQPDTTAGPTMAGLVKTLLGVAGLVPPHFPNASEADWKALYASFAETGPLVGVYTNWADSPATEGKPPRVFETVSGVRKQQELTTVAALGIATDAPGGVKSTVNWGEIGERGRFVAAAAAVAKEYRPAYLALGVEVNRLWESDRAAFDGFVVGYGEAYDAIKRESPGTKVFTVFQLEYMRGGGKLSGQPHTAHWDLIARFGDKLDIVGFTTYPFLDYETPEAIPAGYYREAAQRAEKPVAFTEVGWPSAPLAAAPTSGFGGTPEEQAAFVRRFFELTKESPPLLALWAFPFDVGASGGPFATVALRDANGVARPALAAWQEQGGR